MSLDRDGGVDIEEFDSWLRRHFGRRYSWDNVGDLVEKISAGSNKPRYEVQLDGDNNVTRIRAIQGHSRPVDDDMRNLVRLLPGDAQYLWHATTEHALPKILESGILPGIMCKRDGRNESYWSVADPMNRQDQIGEGRGRINYEAYRFKNSKVNILVRIDSEFAMASGCVFNQTLSHAALCRQPVMPEAILEALDMRNGRVVYRQEIPERSKSINIRA